MSQPIHITTAVWGDWHLDALLELALPSLLAPGNLPALAARHQVAWTITTRVRDLARLRAAGAYRALAGLLPVIVRTAREETLADPIAAHVAIWRDGIRQARRAGALAFALPPDVVWADGSMAHLADLLAAGKRAICAAFPRVASETFCQQLAPVASIAPRLLVQLALDHLHPLTRAYAHDSRSFPSHAEMVVWPVGQALSAEGRPSAGGSGWRCGEPPAGLSVRVLARELMLFDPRRFAVNSCQLPDALPDPAELHMVADSDDLFGVSLAPAHKDGAWYEARRRAAPEWIARWWLRHDSPANDLVAATPIRWHAGPIDPALWTPAEAAAAAFIDQVAACRAEQRRRAAAPVRRRRAA